MWANTSSGLVMGIDFQVPGSRFKKQGAGLSLCATKIRFSSVIMTFVTYRFRTSERPYAWLGFSQQFGSCYQDLLQENYPPATQNRIFLQLIFRSLSIQTQKNEMATALGCSSQFAAFNRILFAVGHRVLQHFYVLMVDNSVTRSHFIAKRGVPNQTTHSLPAR